MATHLTVGARIYRPARLVEANGRLQIVLDSPSMKDFGDGTFMLRAAPLEAYLPGWLVVPWETTGGRVCVCDEPIPDGWTYFEVIFEDVNFVAVSPVAGDPEELRRVHLEAARRGREIEATGKRSAPLG
jgi:hypothetical protein